MKSTGEKDQEKAQKAADLELAKMMRSSQSGVDATTAPARQLFDEFLEQKRRTRAHETCKNFVNYARLYREYFDDSIPLSHLSCQQIDNWRDWMLTHPVAVKGRSNNLSKKTVIECLSWLSAVCRYFDLPNEVRKVDRPKRTQTEAHEQLKFFTPDELRITGKLTDDPKAVKVLKATFAELRESHGDIVLFPYGDTWFSKTLREACRRAKIPVRGPHKLRHTFISMAIRAGWPLPMISKWCGHSSTMIMSVYGYLVPEVPLRLTL